MAPGKAPDKPATCSANVARSPLSQGDIEIFPGAVKDTDSVEKYLASALLRQADEPLTLLHLVGILFQIMQMAKSIPLPITNAIHAVAFLLKQQAASEIAKTIAQQLTESLSSSIVNNVTAAIALQV